MLAGNFNMTNVDELFRQLVDLGQYPKERSDTVTVMEKIGHFLDDEVQRLYTWFKPDGYDNMQINEMIIEHLDVQRLLRRAARKFDGGYVIGGLLPGTPLTATARFRQTTPGAPSIGAGPGSPEASRSGTGPCGTSGPAVQVSAAGS